MATVEYVECVKCGDDNVNIPKKLKCSKCGSQYVYDKKLKKYFLKTIKCGKCGKMSETIATQHVCDKCGEEYVYDDKMGWFMDKGLYPKNKGYFYNRMYVSNFLGDLWIGVVTLVIALLFLSYLGKEDWALIGIVPLLIAVFMFYRFVNRLVKSKFKFSKIVETPEEKLSEKAKKLKKKGEQRAKGKKFGHPLLKVAGRNILAYVAVFIFGLIIFFLLFGNWSFGGETVEIKGVQFVAPAGWTIQENPEPGIDILISGPSEGGVLKPHFSVSRELTLMPFDMEVDAVVNTILDKGALILEQNDLTVDGYNATEIIFVADHPVSGEAMKGKFIMLNVMGAGDIVIIMFKSKVETYSHNLAIFNQSLATLKIVDAGI